MCVTQQRYLNRDKKIQIFGKVPYIIVKKKKKSGRFILLSNCLDQSQQWEVSIYQF